MTVEPRAHTPRDPSYPTHGWRVAKVARAKGKALMPWQQLAADVAHEYDPDTGFYRYDTVVVSVPRQAGKTELESDAADARCLWYPGQRVRITMQDGKTADEWMREQHFVSLAEAPPFRDRYELSRRAGAHGVVWPHTGSAFTTFPPKREALHSKQTDVAFIDEAWAHSGEVGRDLKQAITPTMATRDRLPPGPQTWVVSTRGDHTSVYLDEYIARGKASLLDPAGSRVCFVDYGVPESGELDVEDVAVLASYHPAVGHTQSVRTLEKAREDFRDPETGVIDLAAYARAYGNRSTKVTELVFPDSVWTAAGVPRQPVPARAGLALDVSPDGRQAAVAAGWRAPHNGRPDDGFVELLHAGPVTRELPQLVAELARARGVPVWVDRQAQAALEVVDAIGVLPAHQRCDVEFASMAQYGSACVAFHRGVFDATVHHPNDPDLDAAVQVLATRKLPEGGFGWARAGSSGTIVGVVAATLALRGFAVLPQPRRKAVARA